MHKHTPIVLPGFRNRYDWMGIRWMTAPVDGGGTSGTSTEPPASSAPAGGEQLGAAGQQAIDRMKGERNAARTELKAWTDLGVTAEQVRDMLSKSQTDADQAQRQQAIDQAVTAQREQFTARLREMAVRAQATALGFHNPDDALQKVDLATIPVGDDLVVDAAVVKSTLDDLVKASPYLVKPANESDHRSAGIGAVGSGGGSVSVNSSPQDLLRAAYSSKP